MSSLTFLALSEMTLDITYFLVGGFICKNNLIRSIRRNEF